MLGKYTLDNFKKIKAVNPSLSVNTNTDEVAISIYVGKGDEREVIAAMTVNKIGLSSKGEPLYAPSKMSGAYPGFGSLLYQSMLIELGKIDVRAGLISDRENVSDDAKGIYAKMLKSEFVAKRAIPVDSPVFIQDRDDNQLDEDLDCVYSIAVRDVTPEMLFVHNKMLASHEKRQLGQSELELINEAVKYLGEWVYFNKEALQQEMKNGFPELIEYGVVTIDPDDDFDFEP